MTQHRWLVAVLAVALSAALAAPAGAQQAQEPRDTDLACPPEEVPPAGFDDTAGNTHEAAIDCAAWHEVTTGITPTQYGPAQLVRRDQMATFIARMLDAAGLPLPESPPHRFPDVPPEGTHTRAINQLAELGVVGGFADGTYRPAAQVRRDQMASFIERAVEEATEVFRDPEGQWFTDTAGNTHERSINVLASEGVVAGFADGTYRPALDVRRDQMASFLMRALDLIFEEGLFFFAESADALLTGGNVLDDRGQDPEFNQGQVSGLGFVFVTTDSDRGELCYFVTALVDGPVTGTQIHRGAMDEAGPQQLALEVDEGGEGDDCVQAGDLAADIEQRPQDFYVQVATEDFPDGAVRGQFAVETVEPWLSWGNVVVEADDDFTFGHGERDAQGAAFVQFDDATGVFCSTAVVDEATAPFTTHRLHAGQAHENGPVQMEFPAPEQADHPLFEGELWLGGGCEQLDPQALAAIAADLPGHYVQVDSEAFPEGVVRGQLDAVTLEIPLSWQAEVDDDGNPNQGEPDASGVAVLQLGLESGRLCNYVETDATGPFVGNHIHEGMRGENGPIVIGLEAPDDDTGTVSACQDEDADELFDLLIFADQHYVNVHTAGYPDGAVRGQLDAGFDFEEPLRDDTPPATAGAAVPAIHR